MEELKNLKQKLFEFQKLHLRIGKNAEAGAWTKFTYKYATLDQIWDHIQDKMDELGIVESSAIKYNDNHDVFVYTTLYNVDDTSDTMCSLFPLDSSLSPQDMGKVVTYGRRYNLVALLNLKIVWEDDDAQGVGVGKVKATNGDKFVDIVLKNQDVAKAKTLLDKAQSGEYVLSDKKLDALVSFIDSNV